MPDAGLFDHLVAEAKERGKLLREIFGIGGLTGVAIMLAVAGPKLPSEEEGEEEETPSQTSRRSDSKSWTFSDICSTPFLIVIRTVRRGAIERILNMVGRANIIDAMILLDDRFNPT